MTTNVELLIATLRNADADVRWEAAKALKEITGQDFGEAIEEWENWWKENFSF